MFDFLKNLKKYRDKVVVDPEFVAQTLDWCNSVRAEDGKEPLEKLPLGIPGDPRSCPCGAATGYSVTATHAYNIGGRKDPIRLPSAVATFVYNFDGGKLPQYEVGR